MQRFIQLVTTRSDGTDSKLSCIRNFWIESPGESTREKEQPKACSQKGLGDEKMASLQVGRGEGSAESQGSAGESDMHPPSLDTVIPQIDFCHSGPRSLGSCSST